MLYNSTDFYHNSRLKSCKNPSGALSTSSMVKFSVSLSHSLAQRAHILLCIKEPGKETYHLLGQTHTCKQSVTVKMPKTVGLVYYYFIINDGLSLRYYGAKSGEGDFYELENLPNYQITLFEPNFKTPQWFKKSIMYQIFPDRFNNYSPGNIDSYSDLKERAQYHRQKNRKIHLHENWKDQPMYKAQKGEPFYNPCDFYGGTLVGITQKLEYIKSLGANCIYLNPVFESPSNHRYDCSDYMKIDPILGTNEDFTDLCENAKRLEMRVIIDGVFSHTGDDSVYFNKYNNYDSIGAYQSVESQYNGWYSFESYPLVYKSWWGFNTLPETNEANKSFEKFIVTDENSVMKHWIKKGASGWRLDVADELPDDFIALMRKNIKQLDPDTVLLGEVWEDASNKYSMNTMRKYVFGHELDSVMNYPWRETVMGFVLGRKNAFEAANEFETLREHYPKEFYYACMNMLSSHDVPRALSLFGGAPDKDSGFSRDQQALFCLLDHQRIVAKKRLVFATALQMVMPGVPSIYYGDEVGTQGLMDPFNRSTFPWGEEEEELLKQYRELGALRAKEKALQTGRLIIVALDKDVMGIIRFCSNKQDAFEEESENKVFVALFNRNLTHTKTVFIDPHKEFEGADGDLLKEFAGRYQNVCNPNNTLLYVNGLIKSVIEPLEFKIFRLID